MDRINLLFEEVKQILHCWVVLWYSFPSLVWSEDGIGWMSRLSWLTCLLFELTKTCTPSVERNCDTFAHVRPMQVNQLIVLSLCSDAPAFESGDEVVDNRNPFRVQAVGDISLFLWLEWTCLLETAAHSHRDQSIPPLSQDTNKCFTDQSLTTAQVH